MLKKLGNLVAIIALVLSLAVPTTSVFADNENANNNEANEQVDNNNDANENNDENDEAGNNNNNNDDEEAAGSSETQETNLIYWIVIGYVFVLSVGLYAFTEGTRKDK